MNHHTPSPEQRRGQWAAAIDQVFADWEQGMAARPQDALADAAMAVADAEHEELVQRLARTTEMTAGLQVETARLRTERDQARHIAVTLENQLAAISDLANSIDTEMRTEPNTQRAAMQHEAVTRIRAILNNEPHNETRS